MLDRECKVCSKEFHHCAQCEVNADTYPLDHGFCSWSCFAYYHLDDPDELSLDTIQNLMTFILKYKK